MNPYALGTYREILRAGLERDPQMNQADLARAAGVQTSYMSNVMAGRANLSSDQLYQTVRKLGLGDDECEYALLLLEIERCDFVERRERLENRAREIRHAHLKTAAHVKAQKIAPDDLALTEYYLEPYAVVVHVFLGMPRFAKDPAKIATVLGIGAGKLKRVLGVLERLGYLERKRDGGYAVLRRHRHLPDDSPLCLTHQTLLRSRSAEHLARLAPKSRYAFSVTFSATPEVYDKMRADFLAYVKKCETAVKNVKKPARVYQINFDLFPWEEDE